MSGALPKKLLFGRRWRLSEHESSTPLPTSSLPLDSTLATASIRQVSTQSARAGSRPSYCPLVESAVGVVLNISADQEEIFSGTKTIIDKNARTNQSVECSYTSELRKQICNKQIYSAEVYEGSSSEIIADHNGNLSESVPLSFDSRSVVYNNNVYTPSPEFDTSPMKASSASSEFPQPLDCRVSDKGFPPASGPTHHQSNSSDLHAFICNICGKTFTVKENLTVHRRTHTRERPYPCDVCGRAFEHSGKLNRHLRIHTGERPHRCTVCGKSFVQSGQLVIHMRAHTGEKPYGCETCGKAFTCSKQLKVHRRTHTGEKPYKCDICGKAFGYNHVLKTHKNSHYGQRLYKCRLCHATFTSKKLMEQHLVDCKSAGNSDNNGSNNHGRKSENNLKSPTEVSFANQVSEIQHHLLGVDSVSQSSEMKQTCSTNLNGYRIPPALNWLDKLPTVDSNILRAASNFPKLRNSLLTQFNPLHGYSISPGPAIPGCPGTDSASPAWSPGDSTLFPDPSLLKPTDVDFDGNFALFVPGKRYVLSTESEWTQGKSYTGPTTNVSPAINFLAPPSLPLLPITKHSSHEWLQTTKYTQILDSMLKEKIALVLNHLVGADTLRLLGHPECDTDLILEKVILQLGGTPCSHIANHSHSDSCRDRMICNLRTLFLRYTPGQHNNLCLQQGGEDLDVENVLERLYQECRNRLQLEYHKQHASHDRKSQIDSDDSRTLQYPQSLSSSPPVNSQFAFTLVGNASEVEQTCEKSACETEMQVAA